MITIIIPAHNEKDNLKRLLPFLNRSSAGNRVEVIVSLSSANSDGSEHLDVDGKVSFLRCAQKGRAFQMNMAAGQARGGILVFLHADVTPPKTFLKDIEMTLEEGYEAGFFSYRFDKKSLLLKMNASFTAKDGIFTGGGDQCLFIRKPVFFDLGKFDEKQVLMEDFEFFERMKKIRYGTRSLRTT